MDSENIKKYILKGLPEEWYDYASELKEAAQTLWKSNQNTMIIYQTERDGNYTRKYFSRTYFFLLGIAIENLIKGILISENPDYLKDGKISANISSGHNISFLAEQIKSLTFNDTEQNIFKTLSDVIPYWGKYPIPKNFNNLKKEVFFNEKWYNELIAIFEKLEVNFYKLNLNGIDGSNNIRFPKLVIEFRRHAKFPPLVRICDAGLSEQGIFNAPLHSPLSHNVIAPRYSTSNKPFPFP